jgi:large subunit ribosomal protein L24
MQRIADRVKRMERSVTKKKAAKRAATQRSLAWEMNQHRAQVIKEYTALVRADRQNRKIDWETGPLAPRRDVGDKAKTYGTMTIYNFGLPKKLPENRMKRKEWTIFQGDRVVITRGRDIGKIGEVVSRDFKTDSVHIRELNKIDVAMIDAMKKANKDPRDVVTVEQDISLKDIKLVYPLPDPVTGIPRDVVIEKLERIQGLGRVVPKSGIAIPRPAKKEFKDGPTSYPDDTLESLVHQRTFYPSLIRVPFPPSALDELRNKYSKFRTRHEYEYTQSKLREEAKMGKRKDLIKTMRTPLQELAELRQRKKAGEEKELTQQQLAKIGEVIAQEQHKKRSGPQPAEA